MRIENLAQNIILLDDADNLIKNIPLVNGGHFVGYSTLQDKHNFQNSL